MILACFGNSITEGYMVPRDKSWPAILEQISEIKTLNFGISGDTTFDALGRLETVLNAQHDAVFVELGINDFFMGIPMESTKKNLGRICQTFLDRQKEVFLAGFSFKGQGSKNWEGMYRELSAEFAINLYPNIFKGISGNSRFFLPDGLHPNSEGYNIIAQNIADFLQENLPHSLVAAHHII